MTDDPLPRLRRICLALPHASERLSHGEPTWFYHDRTTFVTYAKSQPRRPAGLLVRGTAGSAGGARGVGAKRFFRPPYVGHRGWLGVYLDVPVHWSVVEGLVTDAYRVVSATR